MFSYPRFHDRPQTALDEAIRKIPDLKCPNDKQILQSIAKPYKYGSAMVLVFRGVMKPGETVLINGATGFAGRIAIQVAKHYRAKKIIDTGRNEKSLQSLLELGADEIISIPQTGDAIIDQLKNINAGTPVDIIIDYL